MAAFHTFRLLRPLRLAALAALLALPAQAQEACTLLADQIARIEASPSYLNLVGAERQAAQAETRLADAEAQFLRAGCQSQLQTGGLDATCQAFSGAVLRARSDLDHLHRSIRDAQALAGQHQALLAQYGQQRCGSGVSFSGTAAQREQRSLLEGDVSLRTSPGFLPEPVEPTPVLVDVPLPMRRPAFPADAPEAPEVAADEELRLYAFGDRVIRIVGPVTAYSPEAATGLSAPVRPAAP